MHAAVLLLSALPSAFAIHAYSVPAGLSLAEADTSNSCVLPDDYHIKNYSAESESDGQTLSYSFIFGDDSTKVSTPCEFNSSSIPVLVNGNPRYECDNTDVQFVWDGSKLTMVEKVCPGANGAEAYEVAGSTRIYLQCPETGGACTTNTTDYKSLFVSLNPILNPSRV
ncbi:hypothetical protein EDB81DRAFT_103420 [Dactylonectria macrodidyma]|uniref:AA1-like domain-containing protein n=1 Tax=Dactylonectria macrodidyma TaxID=307937 RepID=A0A9P9E7Y5_9HYPO|nr:hypothetical protein EDB81DRAFT_103420 [Dactylonectria macrodidyma]